MAQYKARLTDGGGCLGRKVEASEVGIAGPIVHEAVAADSFVVGDGEVGAGVEVYEVDHVGEGLEEPQHHLKVTSSGV